MRVALTGHTGFIGSHLLKKMVELGYEVDTHTWEFSKNNYDVCIHLAAVTHIKSEFDGKLFDANIVMASEIFRMPCRIVYASSCSAAHLTNPYAYSKRYAEYLGSKRGDTLGLRFHNVYGPGNNKGIVKALLDKPDGSTFNVRGPEIIRDYIYIDDVVNFIINSAIPVKLKSAIPVKLKIMGNKNNCNSRRCRPEYMDIPNVGVVDVGTGVGTQTMDLVNLFMAHSGKKFNITVSDAGDNEPKEMISNNRIFGMPLIEGLIETIKKSI